MRKYRLSLVKISEKMMKKKLTEKEIAEKYSLSHFLVVYRHGKKHISEHDVNRFEDNEKEKMSSRARS